MSSPPSRSNDARRVTPRLLATIAGVGFAVGAVVGVVQYGLSSSECEPLATVPWASDQLDQIGASLGRAGKADGWPTTRAAIEAYGSRWNDAYVEACEVPEGEPRDAAYACLGEPFAAAVELMDDLHRLDPEAIATADATVADLTPPELCVR